MRLGSRVVFSAHDPDEGREPWVTDGGAGGTRRLARLSPGIAGSDPHGFTVLGDEVFFFARQGLTEKLWKTDGTPEGTRKVRQLAFGGQPSFVTEVERVGDRIFFILYNRRTGADAADSEAVLVRVDLRHLAMTRHRVVRRPQCPRCGDPEKVSARGNGELLLSLTGPAGSVLLGQPRTAVVRALGRMERGARLGELIETASAGGWNALPELYALLDRLAAGGAACAVPAGMLR